jgi:predicted RNase H-like nuclease (RuvC/YqgF family)
MGKGESMSDTEKEIDELQRKLAAKTREIEALVADEQELGDINAMESTDYTRLKTYVEELIEKWQEADVDRSGSNPDTPVNRLIADRQEIEEQILALQLR